MSFNITNQIEKSSNFSVQNMNKKGVYGSLWINAPLINLNCEPLIRK